MSKKVKKYTRSAMYHDIADYIMKSCHLAFFEHLQQLVHARCCLESGWCLLALPVPDKEKTVVLNKPVKLL